MIWTTRQRSEIGPFAAVVAGDGPTLVLIHGVGLRAEAWGAQIDALSCDFRIVAIDMPGHGDSAALHTAPTLSDYSRTVATCLETPCVVVGHSFGAMIALDLAIAQPDKVAGVAALNAIYRREPSARAAVIARAARLDGTSVADPTAPLARWFGDTQSPERTACAGWLRAVDPAGYKDAYTVFAHADGPTDAGLKSLACPALFMTGGQEPNSTPAMSRAMADLAPNGHCAVIEDAAHMMPMTHAADVTARIATFAKACLS